MKKHILILTIFVLMASASAVYSANFENSTVPGLNLTTDVDEAFDASHNENKTLVIIFDQDSCVYCDLLKKDVLSNSDVQKQLNGNYVVLLVDVNKNPDIASKYKVFGTPEVHFIASNGTALTKIDGYVGSGEFLKELKEI